MNHWLSEPRRSTVSALIAVATAVVLFFLDDDRTQITGADACVLVLLAYLLPYLVMTSVAFTTASPERVRTWARREARGTVLQRYVYGTAPGPGVSIFIAAAALVVAMVWLPGHIGSAIPPFPRTAVALVLVAGCWICVAVCFAVAFQADNLVEDERALSFPDDATPAWADYMYFALSVMTTFGTTDVTVTSREMRRTVAVNSVIAFVFNTITVASLVSAFNSL
ncbi:DUF1345 domain-containing protein [Actinomadura macrotermitis]|uniref:DUF1345 domain-containing protein n=1 Tax=Actinomadura macrotermitis TaxID=2585200 RepID=A0A7K0C1D0_9ACTN|nr:DUF1345 domain-containing protein [Actinomadura macrotermitis]MQY07271.1 hypothetical protein [Actinomadura macrotermitis]